VAVDVIDAMPRKNTNLDIVARTIWAEHEADFSRAAQACLEDLHITDRHIDYLRRLLPLQARVRLAATFRRLNSRSVSPKTSSALPPELKVRLRAYFHEDLARTESLTGLDLLESWEY
jgi:hypothetical protein